MSRENGLWVDPSVPKTGWECVGTYDNGDCDFICEMCQVQEIRYEHYIDHPTWEGGSLAVGCICAGNLTGDMEAAQQREADCKSRAKRRERWLTRKWRRSAKGNHVLKPPKMYMTITVFLRRGRYGWCIKPHGGGTIYSDATYTDHLDAKLAVFDHLWPA